MRMWIRGMLLLVCVTMAQAEQPLDVAAITRKVIATLEEHQTIEVHGTVTTTADGQPHSTSVFAARFKRPDRWMITWQDTCFDGSFTPHGQAWGDGAMAHLRFTGQAGTQTSTDALRIIASSAGISHALTPWLYDLFQGRTANLIPPDATASPFDHGPVITAIRGDGRDISIIISRRLITSITTTTDLGKIKRGDDPEPK